MGISYNAVVLLRLKPGTMSDRLSESYAKSGSVGFFWGSTWRERRHKRCEDRDHEQDEERSGLGEGSYQTHRTMLGASGYGQFDEREEELERLHKLVRDLELEARGRRPRGNRDNQEGGSVSRGDRYRTRSNQSGSCRHRDHSHSRESCRHRDCSRSWESRRR